MIHQLSLNKTPCNMFTNFVYRYSALGNCKIVIPYINLFSTTKIFVKDYIINHWYDNNIIIAFPPIICNTAITLINYVYSTVLHKYGSLLTNDMGYVVDNNIRIKDQIHNYKNRKNKLLGNIHNDTSIKGLLIDCTSDQIIKTLF